MTSRAWGLLLALVASCAGCARPVPATAPKAHAAPVPERRGATDVEPVLLEYVVVHRRWVEKVLPASPADVKAWSDAPENANAAGSTFQRALVSLSDASDPAFAAKKKKAKAVGVRLANGEDLAKVARDLGAEAVSADGDSAADAIASLPAEVRAAFESLAIGATTAEPVQSRGGFYVLRRLAAGDEQLERAYRKAKAPSTFRALGDDLRARLATTTAARAAIAEAVETLLGDSAVNDADRPKPVIVDRDHAGLTRLPAAAKAAFETFAARARAGDVLPSPAVDGDVLVIARAVRPTD